MFATSFRVRPWTPRARRVSSVRLTLTVPLSTASATSGGSSRESLPLGPSTRTDPSATFTLTPEGTVMGMRPIRDMVVLPHRTEQLAADALLARLAIDENAFRGRQHLHTQALPNGRDLGRADVDAEARPRHALHAQDDGPAPVVVAEPDAERPPLALFGDLGGALEVALAHERLRDGL